MPYNFLIINGPNLGRLGARQPEIYGSRGLGALPDILKSCLGDEHHKVNIDYFQSNCEGELINRLEKAFDDKVEGIIFNAGAYTHTSLALADCLAWINIPFVEVHISNTAAREEKIRHKSMMARHAMGVIAGFGLEGYALAVKALLIKFDAKS